MTAGDLGAGARYHDAVAALREASDAALAATMELLADCARRHRITRMEFLVTSHFYRGDREVECKDLTAIELRYCDDVSSVGFIPPRRDGRDGSAWVGE